MREGAARGQSRNASVLRRRASPLLPEPVTAWALRALDDLAGRLVERGVSANAITWIGIALGALAGILVGAGQFAWAAAAMMVASLGDALDGMVARRARTSSVGGALLDAAGDRYQEFFFLGGVAVLERTSVVALIVTLAAIAGSFMVSYGSAKAEALGIAPPGGWMRRPERALCMCLAAALSSPWDGWAHGSHLPAWCATLPLLLAAAVIAVVANGSAVLRLRAIARLGAFSRTSLRPRSVLATVPGDVVLQVARPKARFEARRRGRLKRHETAPEGDF